MGPQRSPRSGVVCCTAGPGWEPASWWRWPPESDLPVGVEQIDVRLIDDVGSDDNANLDFVLTDTTRLIEQLRRGATVFLHCVAAQSRTPTVAALYGARLRNISADEALREITAVLPRAYPNSAFRAALQRLAAGPDLGILSRRAARSHSASPHQKGRQPMTKNDDDRFPYEQAWLGVRDPSLLADEMVAAGHQLADAAKQGDWSTVFTLLGNPTAPFPVNGWRPGGKAWFTVLHQAAWHGVSADVAAELIRLGALRTLTDSHGRTPYMVRLDRDLDASTTKAALLQNKTLALRSLLRPTPSLLTPERTLALSTASWGVHRRSCARAVPRAQPPQRAALPAGGDPRRASRASCVFPGAGNVRRLRDRAAPRLPGGEELEQHGRRFRPDSPHHPRGRDPRRRRIRLVARTFRHHGRVRSTRTPPCRKGGSVGVVGATTECGPVFTHSTPTTCLIISMTLGRCAIWRS